MQKYWVWLLSHSHKLVILLGLVTALLLPTLFNLDIDSSPSALILSKSPENIFHEETSKIFGNDEVLFIGFTPKTTVLENKLLIQIQQVTKQIEQISGVDRVISLTNALDISGKNNDVTISSLVPKELGTLNLENLKTRLENNPFYKGQLISLDWQTTGHLVFFENQAANSNQKIVRQAIPLIQRALRTLNNHGEVFIGGVPAMEFEGMESMVRDLWVFTPVTAGFVFIILIVHFKSLRGIVLPILSISITLVWTLSAMSITNHPLKPTTLVLPSLLIANGSSYVIHLLNHYYRALNIIYTEIKTSGINEMNSDLHTEALLRCVRNAQKPIIVSAITTMAGFTALVFTEISAIRDLGLFAVLGVFLSYLFCVHLIPMILFILPVPKLGAIRQSNSSQKAFLNSFTNFVTSNKKLIYLVSTAVAIIAITGAFRVKVQTNYLDHFRSSSQVARATQLFQERLSGLSSFSIIIQKPDETMMTSSSMLSGLNSAQELISKLPGVDQILSITDSLKLLNQAFHEDNQNFFKLPADQEILNEMLEILESDPREICRGFLSEDHTIARLLIRSPYFESTKLKLLIKQIKETVAKVLPSPYDLEVTGTLVLMNLTSDQLSVEQMNSLSLSVCIISMILIYVCRSWRLGLMCMVTAGLPILIFFGFIGWTGISLNVNTSMIAAIAIGITVDNCIQYMVSFKHYYKEGCTPEIAIRKSILRIGKPMISTASVVAIGFLVFGLSQFGPVSQFGLLSALIMGCNLITSLMLLPSLILILKRNSSLTEKPNQIVL